MLNWKAWPGLGKSNIVQSMHWRFLVLSACSLALVGTIWVLGEFGHTRTDIERMRSDLTSSRVSMIQALVQRQSELIRRQSQEVMPQLRSDISQRVRAAVAQVEALYDGLSGMTTPQQMAHLVRETLRPIRFNNGRGYFFAIAMDGTEELFADRPELEGKNLTGMADSQGRFVVRDMIRLAAEQNEGFYEYTWTKPGDARKDHRKVAYVKMFAPLNWVIGAGEYVEDVEADAKRRALDHLGHVSFGDSGYIFAGAFSGELLLGPGKGSLDINSRDADGVYILRELIRTAEAGGGLVQYVLPALGDSPAYRKLSYVEAVPQWGWFVGAGVNLDDIEAAARQRKGEAMRTLGLRLSAVAVLLVLLGAVGYILSRRMARKLEREVQAFTEFFQNASGSGEAIDPEARGFSEMEAMARAANEMVEARRQAEEALRLSEEKYRRLFEESLDPILLADADTGILVDCNAAAERFFGRRRQELVGLHQRELHPASHQREGAPTPDFESAARGDEVGLSDVPLLAAGGEIRYADIQPSRVVIGGRTFLQGVFRDVTRTRQALEELKASEERFHSLFETMSEGVALHRLILDEDGEAVDYVILDVNSAYEQLTGIPRERAVGARATELYGTGDPPLLEEYVRTARTRCSSCLEMYFEPLGRHFSISVFSPGPGLFATVFQDVTARKQGEAELTRAKEAAEAASKAKNEFLGTMSPEIRTPLNGIMAMLQLAAQTPLSAEQRDYVNTALDSSRNLLRILSDILDVSRVEAGRLPILEQPFSIDELHRPVFGLLGEEARRKGLKFEVHVDAALPPRLVGDAGRLRQVILNLGGNALKYTQRGTVRVFLTKLPHCPRPDAVTLHIMVADTGEGIPADKLALVFEPFTQLEDVYTRRHGGAGLGLALVRRLAKLMGANVAIVSEPGQGTEVHVSLVLPVAEKRQFEPEAAEERGGPAPSRILVVDDERVNRMAAERMLQRLGHSAVGAASGQEALAALARERFDCVFMDIQMPDMDGMEATRRIRGGQAGAGGKDIPVVALTAHAMAGDRERFLAAGLDDYLAKPVELDDLKAVLRRILAGDRAGGRP